MKRIVFLAVALLLFAGCEQGSVRDYVKCSNIIEGAARAGTPLVRAGVLDTNEARVYYKYLTDANDILKVWRTVIDSNGTSPAMSDAANKILDKLIDEQVKAIQERKQ